MVMKKDIKKERKFWATNKQFEMLQAHAATHGYTGQGYLSHFLQALSKAHALVILTSPNQEVKVNLGIKK